MAALRRLAVLLAIGLLGASGCSHRYYATDLKPRGEELQGENRVVADDGTVTFNQGRLAVGLRPMTDAELNRQFSAASQGGAHSTNPYTFGDSKVFRTDETPQRFTVFRLNVSNYEYPKVHIDPQKIYLTTDNGRKYYALSFNQLNIYYRRYALGGQSSESGAGGVQGNNYQEWKERRAILRRTIYPDEQIFSAQEVEGYLIFKPLAPDVSSVKVHVPDVVVRFDFKGDPVEMTDVTAEFEREIGRIYPDGRIQISQK